MWWPRAMDCTKLFFCLCIFLEFFSRSNSQHQGYVNSANQVFNTIFHKYNAGVPPWTTYPKPFELTVRVIPIQIESVDVVAQTMTSTIDLEVTWSDLALKWLTETVQAITLSKEKVWHPHISVTNAVGKVDEIDNPDLNVKIDGTVLMRSRLHLTTLCDLPRGATEFNCTLAIGTKMFDSDMFVFSKMSFFDVDKMVVSHSLELTGTYMELTNVAKPNENSTDPIYPGFDCTLTFSETGYTNSAAFHGHTSVLLVLLTVVIALFAQK